MMCPLIHRRVPHQLEISNAGGYYLHEFRVEREFAPAPGPSAGDETVRRTWSCDISRYERLCRRVDSMLGAIEAPVDPVLPLPHPSLEGRMTYLTSCVRFTAGLYASGGPAVAGPAAGSRLTVVGIPPTGTIHYRTA
jgi:hypothetical protein